MTMPSYNWPTYEMALLRVRDDINEHSEAEDRADEASDAFALANDWWDQECAFTVADLRNGFVRPENKEDELYRWPFLRAEWFLEEDRPAALVLHVPHEWGDLVPHFRGLVTEPLPFSWFDPEGCKAWIIRPREAL